MISFRQRVLLSYVGIFLVFVVLLFPFSTALVSRLVKKAMEDRAEELIAKIEASPNTESLIRKLKDQQPMIFFRVNLINDEGKILYDSHSKRLLGPKFSQEYIIDHPEVIEAYEHGSGYHEDYSEMFGEKFAYMARAFDFHGKTYILRTAFPYKYVSELTNDFSFGFLVLITLILLLFSMMNWFIISYLTKPIQTIIKAITPYQEGKTPTLPKLELALRSRRDEFGTLANTLNQLSLRIQNQINTLTEARTEKEVLLESLVEGVIAVDPNMKITFANTSAQELLGLHKELLIGSPFSTTKEMRCELLLNQCQQSGKPLTDNIQVQRDTGKLYLDVIATPKMDGTGAILVMQDKTSHYRILEMRKDFVANASHELKTPITIIRGFAETLHDNPDLPKDTAVEILDKILRNTKRMATLIRDLLTLADIENIPTSRLSHCDLYELTDKCVTHLHETFPNAVVRIHKSSTEPYELIIEPNLMEMAFMNLILNAAKYSNPPAQIDITLRKHENGIEWRISDQGIGIPEADLDHIFERFYRVNKAHSLKVGGSGLGLSIVKTIVDKHAGKLSVTSILGKGTTFTLFLPIRDFELEQE